MKKWNPEQNDPSRATREICRQYLHSEPLKDVNDRGSVTATHSRRSFAFDCAMEFTSAAQCGAQANGQAFIAIPGGRSPRPMFERLTDPEVSRWVPWEKTHIFFVDERCVPPDSDRSNYKQARDLLLSKVPIPSSNIHRFLSELDPEIAAEKYEHEIVSLMGWEPRFDLVVLGLGEDAHVASLFPHSAALKEERRIAIENAMPSTGEKRLTLTIPTLCRARRVIILVTGQEKAAVFTKVMDEPLNPDLYPAQAIRPTENRPQWILDELVTQAIVG